MSRWLKKIAFFSCDDAGAKAPAGEAAEGATSTEVLIAPQPEGAPASASSKNTPAPGLVDIKTYQGSKEVNPNGRKLKSVDRSAFASIEEFDAFLKEAGEDAFLPEENPADKKLDKKVG